MSWSRVVAPAPALRPFVAWYQAYHQDDGVPGRHRGLPSPYLTVIVTVGAPLAIESHPDPRDPGGEFHSLIGGLHSTPAIITHPGWQSGIQLAVHPLAAPALFGVPAGELASRDFELSDVLGPAAVDLHEQINEAVDWSRRLELLDAALVGRLADRSPKSELAEAWRMLTAAAGNVEVGALAAETGWSARQLQKRFRQEIGLSPKAAARVIRFDRARRMVRPEANLAGVAAAAGYYDQAHLAREFREIAGCSPSRWLAEEFRFVQAGEVETAEALTA